MKLQILQILSWLSQILFNIITVIKNWFSPAKTELQLPFPQIEEFNFDMPDDLHQQKIDDHDAEIEHPEKHYQYELKLEKQALDLNKKTRRSGSLFGKWGIITSYRPYHPYRPCHPCQQELLLLSLEDQQPCILWLTLSLQPMQHFVRLYVSLLLGQ